MSRYYGQPGGLRNPFGSTGKKPRPAKQPALPSCYEQVLHGMIAACAHDKSNRALPTVWKEQAACLKEELDATLKAL